MQARAVALDMLLLILEEKKPSHIVFARELSKYPEMEKKERAFARRLATGVIERQITLDFLIGHYSKTRVEKLKPMIREILRMGLYQLYYMEVPPSAACNEAVKLTKKRGLSGLSGYVNGVLRAAARDGLCLEKEFSSCGEEELLSLRYSIPRWLVEKFLSWYGREESERIFSAFFAPPTFTVRVNVSKGEVSSCREHLARAGILAREGEVFGALHLSGMETVMQLPGFDSGWFQVQDESSMLPVLCAGIKAGDYVIDCCAAPGGKTIQAADALLFAETGGGMAECGMVSARDISDYKIAKIRENIARCGFENIGLLLFDAALLREEDVATADVVIADLPCSGLGIIGRKPDIKYNITPKDLEELSLLQRRILEVVTQYLKPGGVLIYSTCTLNPGENVNNFQFLCGFSDLEPESLDPYLPKPLCRDTTKKGYLQLLPEAGKWDGFFVSRFRKKGGKH
jgi:16S rRNA (cytosine967-C5)-methyltransferase